MITDRIIKRIKALHSETLRYIIAGVMTTLVNFTVFSLMTKLLYIDVNVSNVTSISVSIVFAYAVNKLYVFKRRSDSVVALLLEFSKFIGSRLFAMALEVGAVLFFIDIMKQGELLGKLASQVLVVVANYIMSKVIVFRTRHEG